MKRAAIVAMLIAVSIVTIIIVRHNKSDSSTITEGRSVGSEQANAATTPTASASPLGVIAHVTDSANVIDQSTRKQLETTLADLKEHKKIDFAVVTVRSSGGQSARDYSLALAQERSIKIKNEKNSGGLLLLIAVDDRNWHIQVSRSLEEELTNEVVTKLGYLMTDSFRQKSYGEGITRYVDAIIARLAERGHSPKKATPETLKK